MARLKPIEFHFKAKAGEDLKFRSEVSVSDTHGDFAVTIPDELEDVARAVLKSHGKVFQVQLDRPRTHLRVLGMTLEGCKNFIKMVAEDFLHCEVKEELVLVYSTANKVSYIKDNEGRFYSNGGESPEVSKMHEEGSARWHGDLNATNCAPHFRVALAARVFKRVSHIRSSGTSVTYEHIRNHDMPDDSWLKRLNGFCGLHMDAKVDLEHLPQMPYTEEAAQFFYNAMLAMCRIADQVEGLFGNEQALQLAIARNAGFLTAPKDSK